MTATSPSFADALARAVSAKASAVLVGLDPHLALLPEEYAAAIASGERGRIAAAVADFCRRILDAVADLAPAVKPQVAFFEQLGPPGYEALEAVVADAKSKGLLVISDAKRGDIGSTAAAYADYHIGLGAKRPMPTLPNLGADAVTVNAYLGRDSLAPFLAYVPEGRGLFALVKTSNPGSADFQDVATVSSGGARNYEMVAATIDDIAAGYVGGCGYSSVGIVVGATHAAEARALRQRFRHLWFLVPGYGAQGATAGDVAGCFDAQGLGAIVNASRSIIFAHREAKYARFPRSAWAEAARQAALDMKAELAAALTR
jgi:orotidine-5'-phosphate decarboxylase